MSNITVDHVTLDFPLPVGDFFSLKQQLANSIRNRRFQRDQTFRALDDISLSITSGERVAIIGHNGAGKSSLLRTIAGIYPPSRGKVTVQGKVCPILDYATGFEMELTGWENIRIRLLLLGQDEVTIARMRPEITAFAELEDFIHRPVRTYSTGMTIRLAFATTTAIPAEVLVMDEVVGAGDASFIDKANQRLADMMARGQLVVFTSHAMSLVRQMGGRAIWLHQGKIREDGPADRVIKLYEAAAVAGTDRKK